MASETRSSQPVRCPECSAQNSYFDRFCGVCGRVLAGLRWRATDGDGEGQSGNGRLAIIEGARVAKIRFENDGVAPVALVLRARDARMPPWVEQQGLPEEVIRIGPSSEKSIEIPLVAEELRRAFRPEDAQQESDELEAHLPFLTTLSTDPLRLILVLARQPWITPPASLYRFIPVERTRGEGLAHEVAVHKEGTKEVELTDIAIGDDDTVAPPEGYTRLLAADILRRGLRVPRTLGAETPWIHRLRIAVDESLLPEEGLGWFAAVVTYELRHDNDSFRLATRLSGVVGAGPTLESPDGDERNEEGPPDRETGHELRVVNPGRMPVVVRDIEVLWNDGETEGPARARDWLILDGLAAGDRLKAGEERALRLRYDPTARPIEEYDQDESWRKIVIHHDGWQPAGERRVVYTVRVPFGPVDEGTVGIDFGTSYSVVCLMRGKRGYPLSLERLEGDRAQRYLASLMFFNANHKKTSDDEGFLFGEEALGSANIQPANLVRSIKSVVVQSAETEYRFLKQAAGREYVRIARSTQELLNLFIRRLRILAEKGVRHLSADDRREAELGDQRLALCNAVFSHPVEITESMKTALMEASHAAGINTAIEEADEFFGEYSVDEATAAVLAYVHGLLFGGLEVGRDPLDVERVVCFDMGGGTTDLAAVEVEGLQKFNPDQDQVLVKLCSKRGDNRLGGNYLDELLAREILAQVHRQSIDDKAPILPVEVEHALGSESFAGFQLGYDDRMRDRSQPDGGLGDSEAYSIYSVAMGLLGEAEAAKKSLAGQGEVPITVSSDGWPREAGDEAAVVKNFEVVLKREHLEEIVDRELGERLTLLDSLVEGADWQWPQVTTLLFTGQSVRSPIIRKPVVDLVKRRLGDEAEANLILVEPPEDPDAPGFDPKLCVAIGAAIWGFSREQGHWLQIERPMLDTLNFDLTRGAPTFRKVPGLERGASLMTKARIDNPRPIRQLTLYRDRQEFVSFKFPPTRKILVEVKSAADFVVEVDGRQYPGRRVRS